MIRQRLLACAAACAFAAYAAAPAAAAVFHGPNDKATATPIQHVIIIVGENRTFDHLFATWTPTVAGQTVNNLLSEGIVNADGTPGPNASLATQYSASDTSTYSVAPGGKVAYTQNGSNPFPPVMTGGAPEYASDTNPPPFATIQTAEAYDYGLEEEYYTILTTGATGLPKYSVDTRYPNAAFPSNNPFQLTPSISYDAYASSPVHRFYQISSRWIARPPTPRRPTPAAA